MSLENKVDTVSNDLFVKIMEAMPYGIIIADNKGMFVLWNERASDITNITVKALEQQTWSDYFGVYNLDKTTAYTTDDLPMSKALKGEIITDEKLYIRNKDMQEGVYIKVSSFPIIDNGKVIAAVSMFDDITKQQELYERAIGEIDSLQKYLKKLVRNTKPIVYEHTDQELD